MSLVQADFSAVARLLWLVMFAAIARYGMAGTAPEVKFDVLETKTGVYSNVTVTSRAEKYIMVLHAHGVGSIPVDALSQETKLELGYIKDKSATGVGGAKIFAKARESLSSIPKAQEYLQTWKEHPPTIPAMPQITPTTLYCVLGIILLLYLYFCRLASLICIKTGNKPGVLIWLPLLQMIPLFRAAGMSPLWFLALFIPLLNFLAQIIWCFKIAKARGKSPLVGFLLLLPVVSVFAFFYLAVSGEVTKEEEKPAKKFEPALSFG